MKTSVGTFALDVVIAILLTVASLAAIQFGIQPLLGLLSGGPALPTAVHAFFFERSFIQWGTMMMFFFAAAILVRRLRSHWAVQEGLVDLASGRERSLPAGVVRERFERVEQCLKSEGQKAAPDYARQLAERDEEDLDQIYSMLNRVIQMVAALGFFGTVWGISRSMFNSFSNLDKASPDQLKSGLGSFSQALSTALDTTVLALVCGIVLSIAVTVVHWAESGGLRSLRELIERRFDLASLLWQSDVERQMILSKQIIESVREPMKVMAAEAGGAFRHELAQAAQAHLEAFRQQQHKSLAMESDAFRRALERTLKVYEDQDTAVRDALVQALSQSQQKLTASQEAFREQIGQLLSGLEGQNSRLREVLTQELVRISKNIRRVPVVSVQYRSDGMQDAEEPALVREQADDGVRWCVDGNRPAISGEVLESSR